MAIKRRDRRAGPLISINLRSAGCSADIISPVVDSFEQFAVETAHTVTRVVELTGMSIIAVGAFATLLIFLYRLVRRSDRDQAVGSFRSSLGRTILLGLEFLVAADIINTVAVEPTLRSIAVLAGIVVIRTFLSFSLEAEIEGRWPWQRGNRRREV